jgi:5-formaminoimidazole-4-carboxamide-1-beta-D-ribofuranosyl 5'-monophosphate synthetase
MPVDAALVELVTRVGAFHITQRAMKQAQRSMEDAIRGEAVDDATREAYLRAVRTYFEGFDKEARLHLRDVDRRLEHANQVHFNLTAERGVAVKRIEATRSVLDAVVELETAVP